MPRKPPRDRSKVVKLPVTVQKALAGEIKEPMLAELSAHFFDIAGGPRAVAKMLFDIFSHPDCSQMVRGRIIDLVLRATRFANQQSGPRDDYGSLTDADLEREAQSMFLRIKAGTADGEEGEAEGT